MNFVFIFIMLFVCIIIVSGLAKIEGEIIDYDYDESQDENHTKYQLTGIVVHSGQASGGHYYSYIQDRYIFFFLVYIIIKYQDHK